MMVEDRQVNLERVLETLGIEVLGEANGNYKARCPWPQNHAHGDRTGKLYVRTDDGRWTCFRGCGGGGGPLEKLVALLIGLTEVEAKRWLLAKGAASSFEEVLRSVSGRGVEPQRKENSSIAIDYSQADQNRTSSYILGRGFTAATLRWWGIKYDPVLPAIVIPVYDWSGEELVGTIRRLIPPYPRGLPKYLYSPDFQRSKHLFGAHLYRSERGMVTVVEGPLDAIWLHQNGYTDAVALLGSQCSEEQQRILARLGSRVRCVLDNDDAGREATELMQDRLKGRFFVTTVDLPTGVKDVQELGAGQLEEILGAPGRGE